MNKEKSVEDLREQLMRNFEQVSSAAESYLFKNGFKNKDNELDYKVKNVIRYNKKVELIKKDSEGEEKTSFQLYVVELEKNDTGLEGKNLLTEIEFLVEEDKNGEIVNIHTISDLIQEYEGFENIKDVVDKTKENEEKSEEEKDEELKRDSLEELEQEKDEEQKEDEEEKKDKQEQGQQEKKKRKPKHVIEKVNPDKAKMDYWQTVKQAFGLPPQVATLAFAYPVSSEDTVDYANITIYMLDKDGNIIDDLNIDDYFEFDSSTGNNPFQDDVVRHEEDENRGTAQIEENRTMIRLKAKKGNDKNTYISLEQQDDFGDHNDINAGRKILAGTQNVEKQLETDRIIDWDSERELLMKSNAGLDNMGDIYKEAEKHEEHGDGQYLHSENADGDRLTIETCNSDIIPGTNKTWEELSKQTGEGIKKLQERFEREYEKGKSPVNIVEEIEYDYEMAGHEHKHN